MLYTVNNDDIIVELVPTSAVYKMQVKNCVVYSLHRVYWIYPLKVLNLTLAENIKQEHFEFL